MEEVIQRSVDCKAVDLWSMFWVQSALLGWLWELPAAKVLALWQ